MKANCKQCQKEIEVPHRKGTQGWFKWWRKHYKDKHGGFKKRRAKGEGAHKGRDTKGARYCPHCGKAI